MSAACIEPNKQTEHMQTTNTLRIPNPARIGQGGAARKQLVFNFFQQIKAAFVGLLTAARNGSHSQAAAAPSRDTPKPVAATPDWIKWCSRHTQPRHRRLLAKGISRAGHAFVVQQCPCGDFVAVTQDVRTGRPRLFFRGRHFKSKAQSDQTHTSQVEAGLLDWSPGATGNGA